MRADDVRMHAVLRRLVAPRLVDRLFRQRVDLGLAFPAVAGALRRHAAAVFPLSAKRVNRFLRDAVAGVDADCLHFPLPSAFLAELTWSTNDPFKPHPPPTTRTTH